MKLTRNLKILLLLVFSAYLIDLSNCLQEAETSSNTNTEAAKEDEKIFSMKHKKIRTAVAAKKTTTSTQNKAQATTAAAKAKAAAANKNTVANKNTNTNKNAATNKAASTNKNTNMNKNKQSNDLYGADSDLLKQTGLLAAAYAAGKKPQPGFKDKIDLEKMGEIAFHSWIKFFKYTDQVAKDKDAKLRFSQNRKFFTNGEFREQLKLYPGADYQEKDEEGEYKYVSDVNEFYMVAFKHSVVIYQTKMVKFKFKI